MIRNAVSRCTTARLLEEILRQSVTHQPRCQTVVNLGLKAGSAGAEFVCLVVDLHQAEE